MKKLFVLASLLLITITGCINITQPPAAQPATPPVVVTFSANPTEIKTGESATLLWNVTGATSVTIDQGIGNVIVAGTKTVSPTKTTTYALTATNSAGTNTESVTLTVGGFSILPGLREKPHVPTITLTETVFDFIEAAPNTSWQSHLGNVSFLASHPDNANIYYLYNQKLEDGIVYPKVLATSYMYYHQPQSFIQGTYSEITIPAGAHFVAKAGLGDNNPTCSARFCVVFAETSTGKITSFDCINATGDSKLDTFDIDLANISGKTGKFSLLTSPGTTSYAEYGFWVDAKIIH